MRNQDCAETKGALLLNKAAWLARNGQIEQAKQLAAAVRDDAATTVSKKTLAEYLLKNFASANPTAADQGVTITR